MFPGIDPKVDYAFKRVFGVERNLSILAHLIDAVLMPPPGHRITALDLLNPFSDKESPSDKQAILDIKARDQSGRQFNIEMQMLAYGAFRPRVMYYWAKLHQSQLREGEDYRELRPTVSICFVDTVMFPDTASHHLVFELRERQHEVVFSDQLVVHILELPKFTKLAEELTTPLDLWLFFLRHAEHLDIEALPGALEIPEVQRAIKELLMLTQTDEERERYESRRNYQREVYTAIAEAKDLGRAEGVATGRVIGKIQAFQQLLHRTPTAEAELANLPLEELNRRARELEVAITQQLAPPQ